MAHELSHVLLRHGTANATKAENPWLQLGQIAGARRRRRRRRRGRLGHRAGQPVRAGDAALRYSRDFEKQADLLGAQIMAKAGYDPRALAHMFETISGEAKSSGGGAPQWMSSHPDPGNRTQYITQEARSLTIATPADQSQFEPIKKAFASLAGGQDRGRARARCEGENTETAQSVGTPGQPVPAPSSQYKSISGGRVFQASVPSNWTSLSSNSSIKAVPENGYGQLNGQTAFTHGVEFGITKASDTGPAGSDQCLAESGCAE